MSSALRYSVVVPVFNEADNIGLFCRKALADLPPGYELLICYDFEGDTTLPALAALSSDEKPAQTRLVKNDLGRGVRYAIEAGMRAASAPIVVVMMADLSDDFAKVEALIGKAEAGADVVCASRYMRGGSQIGGPRLKGLMSRVAGLTLHWFAGLPTHDPTNSFKAYRKSFLEQTQIESPAGFCLGLELTAKAHFRGGLVAEVPATWHDRSAGESRFQLRKWLPLYIRWYFWAFEQRYRPALRIGLLSLVAILVFLSNLTPHVLVSTGIEESWQYGLNHAATHGWRAGIDYVFTYGPLGFLMCIVFDPALYPLKLAWEILITGVFTAVTMRAMISLRSWPARAVLLLLLTVFSPVLGWSIQECKSLIVVAGLGAALLYSARPSIALAAAALSLFAVLALTKFTFFLAGGGVGLAVLTHVASSRGWRPAVFLAAWWAGSFAALWTIAGQSFADLPTFIGRSLTVAGSYAHAMTVAGPGIEVAFAVVAAALVFVAVWFSVPIPAPRSMRFLAPAAVAWMLFLMFKGSFVRHFDIRVQYYFWCIGVLGCLLPTSNVVGWRTRIRNTSAALALCLGLYGAMSPSDRWSLPVNWAKATKQTASNLSHPQRTYDRLVARRELARDEVALPCIVATVGDRTVDVFNARASLAIMNGLNWTPRPVFQSYVAHAPELQRLNRDFFGSASAPDFVLFHHETIDNRLPTQDDGPALLELLRRYESLFVENGVSLLQRRSTPRRDPVGEVLLDREFQFGETIDLAALGDGPKAVSFQIDDSMLGRLRQFTYRPPTMSVEVKLRDGQVRQYRLTPNMVADPILIDPLPQTAEDFTELLTHGLPMTVMSLTITLGRPGLQRYFAAPMRCKVWSVQGLLIDPCSRDKVGN